MGKILGKNFSCNCNMGDVAGGAGQDITGAGEMFHSENHCRGRCQKWRCKMLQGDKLATSQWRQGGERHCKGRHRNIMRWQHSGGCIATGDVMS